MAACRKWCDRNCAALRGLPLFAAEINPASRLAAITGYTVPVIGTIGALIFLGEAFTGVMVVGALLILGDVYLSERIARYLPAPGSPSAA